MEHVGRNDPCPCRSGRKFKHCCLTEANTPTTPEGLLAQRLNGREKHLFEEIVAWAQRHLGRDWADEGSEVLGFDAPWDEMESQLLLPWLVYHHPAQGAPPVERYLAARAQRLSADDRAILEAQRNAWLSIWEVTEVRPGVGVGVRDLLTAEERFVHEVSGSRTLERWASILGYVADYPGVHAFAGIHPAVLRPMEAQPVLSAARARAGVRTRRVPPERMRAPALAAALIRDWRTAVHDRAMRASAPPKLCNTDGDPLLLTKDRLGFSPERRDDILRRLEALEGAHRDPNDGRSAVITCSKPGNAMHRSWDDTTIARIEVTGDELVVETNSLTRARAIRVRIEEACGEWIRHLGRETKDPVELTFHGRARGEREAPPPRPHDPQAQTLIREFLERHYESWIDEEIPALGGLTPREAAGKPGPRQRLVALLKEFEQQEAMRPEGERYDVGTLRAALRLDPEEKPARV